MYPKGVGCHKDLLQAFHIKYHARLYNTPVSFVSQDLRKPRYGIPVVSQTYPISTFSTRQGCLSCRIIIIPRRFPQNPGKPCLRGMFCQRQADLKHHILFSGKHDPNGGHGDRDDWPAKIYHEGSRKRSLTRGKSRVTSSRVDLTFLIRYNWPTSKAGVTWRAWGGEQVNGLVPLNDVENCRLEGTDSASRVCLHGLRSSNVMSYKWLRIGCHHRQDL
jgi:hypothetical protein